MAPQPDRILEVVADYYGDVAPQPVTAEALRGPRSDERYIREARRMAICLLRESGLSTREIARLLGRTKSTITILSREAYDECASNEDAREVLTALRWKIGHDCNGRKAINVDRGAASGLQGSPSPAPLGTR